MGGEWPPAVQGVCERGSVPGPAPSRHMALCVCVCVCVCVYEREREHKSVGGLLGQEDIK